MYNLHLEDMKMKSPFYGQKNFKHGRTSKLGIVLVNLGTPDAPEPKALRRYLGEFLSDHRVVEIPKLIWKIILHGIILRIRPKKSAKAYAKVWTDNGSPLMALSQAITDKVSLELSKKLTVPIDVKLAMRYGNPSINDVLLNLHNNGAEKLVVLPLYPQYSGATTGSVADAVFQSLMKWRWVPELRLMGAYYDNPQYIDALAQSIIDHRAKNKDTSKLLISFHGMPKATLLAGDPYFCQCHKTARLLAEKLNLEDSEWELVFQSRFGKAEWLQPYIAQRLESLPSEGIKSISVVCPGFAVDCVETLEEIALEGRDSFLAAGGEEFQYIPSLNTHDDHIHFLSDLILSHASGWPEIKAVPDSLETAQMNDDLASSNIHYEKYREKQN